MKAFFKMKRQLRGCRVFAGLLGPALVFVLAQSLMAQVAGRISGYVRDSSGGAVVPATVTAGSEEQQLKRSAQADDTGFYNLLAVRRESTGITFEAAGFDKQVQSGVQLTSGESLAPGRGAEVGSDWQTEVTVSSTATLVNTTNQSLSALVDDRRVVDLPLHGPQRRSAGEHPAGRDGQSIAPQEMTNTRDRPEHERQRRPHGGQQLHLERRQLHQLRADHRRKLPAAGRGAGDPHPDPQFHGGIRQHRRAPGERCSPRRAPTSSTAPPGNSCATKS